MQALMQPLFQPMFRLLPLAALIAGGMTACGDDTTPHTAANSTSGVVTGSYFRHAKVCIDANNNGRCDAGETSTYTDGNGSFQMFGQGAVTVEVGTDATRYDPDTSKETAITQPLVFRAAAGANVVVNAISTELQALAEDNGGDLNTAKASLAAQIGVPVDKLLVDHNKESDASIKALLKTENDQALDRIADSVAEAGASGDRAAMLRNHLDLQKITNIVVIYAENRSFDNLYGLFPGANGIANALANYVPQKDVDGSTLSVLPPVWGGLTAAGQTPVVTQAQTVGLDNKPFQIDSATGFGPNKLSVAQGVITRDLVHRFYNNQMQINGGKNDKFTTYSDAGGLAMGYFDGSKTKLWALAQKYALADNFFQGAFGGSFLNHQYLICACAPYYPNADKSVASGSISKIDTDAAGNFVRLTAAATSPASVLNGAPVYANDSNLTPDFYAVNTMQPPYQPSSVAPASTDTTKLFANPATSNVLPPQTATNIGDLLTAKGISWAWYTGSWNTVSTLATTTRAYTTPVPNFQFHHQPFNYFANMDPVNAAAYRAAHLRDYDSQFVADAAAGKLPAVAFYKPQGNVNQHPGYANVADGDSHIADVISQLQASPQWKNMLVVITYDEFGGQYDHVAPPKADRWGPGTRIPAIIISPYAKKGYVDHKQYDTASILRFITHRYSLKPLDGLTLRDQALATNNAPAMGDLTGALDFSQK